MQLELSSGSGLRNEATTRLQMVDHLIFRCLGWDVRDCVTEDTYEGTFTDYSLGVPMKLVVWEAKREVVVRYFQGGISIPAQNRVHFVSNSCLKCMEIALVCDMAHPPSNKYVDVLISSWKRVETLPRETS
jgi:hypothetical protein